MLSVHQARLLCHIFIVSAYHFRRIIDSIAIVRYIFLTTLPASITTQSPFVSHGKKLLLNQYNRFSYGSTQIDAHRAKPTCQSIRISSRNKIPITFSGVNFSAFVMHAFFKSNIICGFSEMRDSRSVNSFTEPNV